MSGFEAFHLPVPVGERGALEALRAGTLECRYPRPEPALLDDVLARLREAGRALAERPVAELVDVIDAAAARLADPDDELRRSAEALLPAATGYSPPMVRLILDRMTADWRAGPLRALLDAELGSPAVLDAFQPRAEGTRGRAYGPDLAFHVFAGNVPGVAVTSLVRSLLLKAPSLGKLASGEPVLPVLFARAIASVDADAGDALAVTYWRGGDEQTERRVLDAADVVVAYGRGETVASLRRRVSEDTRLVVHGPRFSVGLVGRDALDGPLEPLARRIALAAATFDQQGCVSPHAVWVEDADGQAAPALAAAAAAALETLERELPRGRVSAAEASAIHQGRGTAELRAHAGEDVRVFAGSEAGWTVVYDANPGFRPSCLNRFLHVHPIADLQRAPDLLRPVAAHLQSVAIEGAGSRLDSLADRLARVGASRITSFERLPWPPSHWRHDGRGPLRELLRWVDIEV